MRTILFFLTILFFASCDNNRVIVSYDYLNNTSKKGNTIIAAINRNDDNSRTVIVAAEFGNDTLIVIEEPKGIYIFDSKTEEFHLSYSFLESNRIIFNFDNRKFLNNILQISDSKLTGFKVFELENKEYIIYRFEENLVQTSEGLTYSYYLRDFGFLCSFFYFQEDGLRIRNIKGNASYSRSVIMKLTDLVIDDTTFFVKPRIIPPPPFE